MVLELLLQIPRPQPWLMLHITSWLNGNIGIGCLKKSEISLILLRRLLILPCWRCRFWMLSYTKVCFRCRNRLKPSAAFEALCSDQFTTRSSSRRSDDWWTVCGWRGTIVSRRLLIADHCELSSLCNYARREEFFESRNIYPDQVDWRWKRNGNV